MWKSICKAIRSLRDGFDIRLQVGNYSFWYSDWLGIGPLCTMVDFVHISNTQMCVKDVWKNGTWNLDKMATRIPEHIKPIITSKRVPSVRQEAMQDYWV